MVPFDVPCGVSAAAFLLDYPVFYVVTLPSSHGSSVAPGAAAGLLSMQPLRMLYIGISLPLSQHGGGSSSSSCRDDVGGGEPESELDLMQCTCPESLFDLHVQPHIRDAPDQSGSPAEVAASAVDKRETIMARVHRSMVEWHERVSTLLTKMNTQAPPHSNTTPLLQGAALTVSMDKTVTHATFAL